MWVSLRCTNDCLRAAAGHTAAGWRASRKPTRASRSYYGTHLTGGIRCRSSRYQNTTEVRDSSSSPSRPRTVPVGIAPQTMRGTLCGAWAKMIAGASWRGTSKAVPEVRQGVQGFYSEPLHAHQPRHHEATSERMQPACLLALDEARLLSIVSASDAIALSILRNNSESPTMRAYSLANDLISPTTLLTVHFPGEPRAGQPTSDFVSAPASLLSRTAPPIGPSRLRTSSRKRVTSRSSCC